MHPRDTQHTVRFGLKFILSHRFILNSLDFLHGLSVPPSLNPNPTPGSTYTVHTADVEHEECMRRISLSRRAVSPSQDRVPESHFVHREEPSARVMSVREAWHLLLFIQCSPTLQYHRHRCSFYKQKCSVGWIGGLLWLAAEWRISGEKLKSYWYDWLGEYSNSELYQWYSEVKWATAQALCFYLH